jgi:hypothetical protein
LSLSARKICREVFDNCSTAPFKKGSESDWGADELQGQYDLYRLYGCNPCHRFRRPPLKHFSTARQFNFLGHDGQHVDELVSTLEGAKVEQAKHIGLGLRFGHDTIEAWMHCRYRVCLQFHRTNLAEPAQATLAATRA